MPSPIEKLLAEADLLVFIAPAFFALRYYWLGIQSYRWVRTTGRLLSSHLDVTPGKGGAPRNIPRVEYEYHAGDTTYRSTRISYSAPVSPQDGRAQLDAIVAQRPLVVYYDPSKPRRSVLLQGAGPIELAWVLASLFFAGIFAFLAFG